MDFTVKVMDFPVKVMNYVVKIMVFDEQTEDEATHQHPQHSDHLAKFIIIQYTINSPSFNT